MRNKSWSYTVYLIRIINCNENARADFVECLLQISLDILKSLNKLFHVLSIYQPLHWSITHNYVCSFTMLNMQVLINLHNYGNFSSRVFIYSASHDTGKTAWWHFHNQELFINILMMVAGCSYKILCGGEWGTNNRP